jgi:hypothetical protein
VTLAEVFKHKPLLNNDEAAAMVWAEAKRLLVRQEATLDTLRVQAVALLSVDSIVAGLFSSRIPTNGLAGLSVGMAYAALGLFGASILLVISILLPRTWTFDHGLTDKLSCLEQGHAVNPAELAYTWARGAESWRATNQIQLNRLMNFFLTACIFTGIGVVCWGIAVL